MSQHPQEPAPAAARWELGMIGLGVMGRNFLLNLAGHGFPVAGFDQDPAKAGAKIGDTLILPMEKFSSLARRMHISVGILTVPTDAAQATADLMVQAGMRAIWNFAPVTLDLPDDVAVENLELFTSLSLLLRKYADRTELAAAH